MVCEGIDESNSYIKHFWKLAQKWVETKSFILQEIKTTMIYLFGPFLFPFFCYFLSSTVLWFYWLPRAASAQQVIYLELGKEQSLLPRPETWS